LKICKHTHRITVNVTNALQGLHSLIGKASQSKIITPLGVQNPNTKTCTRLRFSKFQCVEFANLLPHGCGDLISSHLFAHNFMGDSCVRVGCYAQYNP